jgi:hypothetical protein
MPRRRGVIPDPRIVPIDITNPVAVDHSERAVNLEMAANPTAKKMVEKIA